MKRTKIQSIVALVLGSIFCLSHTSNAAQIGTAFTYQGHLYDANSIANGSYDFQFKLYDDPSSGSQIGTDVNKPDVNVIDGCFTIELDFGSAPDRLNGDTRYLQIGIRPGEQNDPNTYTPLTPRQKIYPTPYALALPGLRVQQNSTSPNILGGHKDNIISSDVYGAVIAGGGKEGALYIHKVTDCFCTVGGGVHNQAGDDGYGPDSARYATVAGGASNTAGNYYAAIGGGGGNIANEWYTTVAGGQQNTATGNSWSTVGGGIGNEANAVAATIPGGWYNTATGSYAFAAGRRAKANHNGAFVWADQTDADFASTAQNQFLIRAGGGVGIATNSPDEMLHVAGNIKATGDIYVSENTVNAGTPISSEQLTNSTSWVLLTTFDLPDQDTDRLATLNVRLHAKGESGGETAVFIVRGFCYGTGSTMDLADHYASAPILGAINIRSTTYTDYYLNLGPFAASDNQKWRFIVYYRTRNASYAAYIDELEWQVRSIRYEY